MNRRPPFPGSSCGTYKAENRRPITLVVMISRMPWNFLPFLCAVARWHSDQDLTLSRSWTRKPGKSNTLSMARAPVKIIKDRSTVFCCQSITLLLWHFPAMEKLFRVRSKETESNYGIREPGKLRNVWASTKARLQLQLFRLMENR